MGVDLPAVVALPFGVDRDHDALRSELPRTGADQLGTLHGGRLDGDLVRTGAKQGADLIDLANAATDGEWDEDLARRSFDHVDQGGALLGARLDVEEDELVGTLLRVGLRHGDRVALIMESAEMGAFDHAATGDIKTGNDPLEQHGAFQRLRTGRNCRAASSRRLHFARHGTGRRSAGRRRSR